MTAGPIRKKTLPRLHRFVYLALLLLAGIFNLSGCTATPSARPAPAHLTAGDWVDNGLALGRAHRWTEALICFDRATALDSRLALAWANHGTALLNLNRPAEALKSYQRAKRLNPRDPYVFGSLGSACHALGKPEEAIAYADQALAWIPPSPRPWPTRLGR